ncbi:putative Zn-dependent protease containing TPR repeats [hydrothermal vent metagenome]|uniref:Putative Zn-dependent protease containing TPR repeats n=1 Tax=hydrothermal vent metagenome TaxID=652676 RepID=A0A3B1AI88_9ZZZZ
MINITRIFVVLVLALISTTSVAFDLGKMVKEITKEKPTESSTEPANEQPQSGVAGLSGILGETPVAEEVAIGREIAGRLLGASPLVDDKGLQLYVNQVGAWVAQQSGRPELTWYFGVIESDDINAFAAPGGYIMVTKGLYKRLKNEAELAGVLAHEVGHVIKKHHLKILQKGKLIDMGSGLLRKQAGSGQQGQAIGKMVGSGAEILARGLDKEAEYEADRIGVVLATRAGYDSYGLPAVLQEIGHVGADDSSVSLLFKTHPHPDVRAAELGDAMGERFDQYEGKLLANRLYEVK